MRIVLDTNVLLVSISSKSRYRPILDSFLNEAFELCVTTDILLEYEEIIGNHMGENLAAFVLQLIENAPNVRWITKYFKWNLIALDEDDNKFVDCAIACDAKFLVSDDRHFNALQQIPFPKVAVLTADEFNEIIKKEK
ncbi:MAG: putative toxin-antitoxin system toxin component, PIN family [Saprospiraceae bacterium]|nr:putative toxin-antitoxin system toxin component, PIN family [Saprospiraceae bacterium]